MTASEKPTLGWRPALRALMRSWKQLIVYELLVSVVGTLLLWPLLLALSYPLLGLLDNGSEDFAVLTNEDLAWFLVSPQGLSAIAVLVCATIWLLLIEYAGLVMLAGGAMRDFRFSLAATLKTIVCNAPTLFILAAAPTCLLLLTSIPFLVLGALTYWLLLSGSDVNFYLAERPPRFWLAATIACVLAAGFVTFAAWLISRWAFAVSICALEGKGWRAALAESIARTRGRRLRLIVGVTLWESFKHVALVALLFGLDRGNHFALSHADERLALIVGKTIALLLLDALAVELLMALFAIGVAGFVAYENEQARSAESLADVGKSAVSRIFERDQTPRGQRLAIVCLLLLGPAIAVGTAIVLEREFMDRDALDRRGPYVTAHRGGPKPAPENSLAALALGIAAGANFAELDVQLTADGQVVLMHDRDLRRMTGDTRDLAEVTFAELTKLRLRAENQPTEERAPTLAQFIAACNDSIRLNIEMKDFGHSAGLPAAVLNVLKEQQFTDRAVVSCFQRPLLQTLRTAEPALPVGVILSATRGDVTRLPVDFLSVNHRLVSGDLVRRAHRQGQRVHVWTVNDRELAIRLLDVGCDNLITSDPALVREVVDWHAELGDVSRMVLRLRRWMRE